MENSTSKIGRFLFAIPFLVFGIMHFMALDEMSAGMAMMVGSIGMAKTLIIVSGIGLIAAAIALVTKMKLKLAMILLAVELGLFIALVHVPMMTSGIEAMVKMGMMGMLKDIGLIGGALFIAGYADKK